LGILNLLHREGKCEAFDLKAKAPKAGLFRGKKGPTFGGAEEVGEQ
jgi:hypothetical protein